MNENLPVAYISALLAILVFAAIYILREVSKKAPFLACKTSLKNQKALPKNIMNWEVCI
jgi:hypothetical protein